MKTSMIEVPASLKHLVEPIQAIIETVAQQVDLAQRGGAAQHEKFEHDLGRRLGSVHRAAEALALAALNVDAPRVLINGVAHLRVLQGVSTSYRTPAGEVPVSRTLYREQGVRNGPTVDLVTLRSGAIGDGWLPATARAMAFLMQQGTSREAEATARNLERLPYSRSAFDTVGHLVGERFGAQREQIEDQLIGQFAMPAEVASISVAVDQATVPMEEPLPRPVGRPRKDAAKVQRVFRMAYCGAVTLHDQDGDVIHTIRYGCMPEGDAEALVESMARDVATLRGSTTMPLSLLADGSPENWNLFKRHFTDAFGLPFLLIDFWHVVEKLSEAAKVLDPNEHDAITKRWKMRLLNCNSAAEEVLDELVASGKEHVHVGKDRPVHDAITYLTNNHDRMRYATARRLGLPIGSGNVEATCKSLVRQRMDRSGSRWKHSGGEHILQLRGLALSDRWEPAMDITLRAPTVRVKVAA